MNSIDQCGHVFYIYTHVYINTFWASEQDKEINITLLLQNFDKNKLYIVKKCSFFSYEYIMN